jgi:hypothetical protein
MNTSCSKSDGLLWGAIAAIEKRVRIRLDTHAIAHSQSGTSENVRTWKLRTPETMRI